MKRYTIIVLLLLVAFVRLYAQTDRREVRQGNRNFRKEQFQQAEIGYKKGLIKDSLSVAANYNLGNTLYRMDNWQQADRFFATAIDSLANTPKGADAFFNAGDSFLKQRKWQEAVDSFKDCLRRNPSDMDAKSNLAYAQKMLQNEQQNQDQNNDQNQDQNNDNDQNQDKDQNQDQNQDNKDNNQDNIQDKDNNQDQNKEQNKNPDRNQDKENQPQGGQQPKISPEAAQQMLQAIQDQEKETQDKVNKEKALQARSKKKEKNW